MSRATEIKELKKELEDLKASVDKNTENITKRVSEDDVWDFIRDYEIATEDELSLVTSINGLNISTLNDVLYVRTGYRDIEQLIESGEYGDAEEFDYLR